jgi:Ca-activated chloride channel family protein
MVRVFLLAGLMGIGAAGQEVAITPRAPVVRTVNVPRANLRMDVQMVQIPVTVTDLRGKPLLGLSKKDFRIFEDDVEQPISTFFTSDTPISAGVVFDSSRSMKTRIHDARQAVEQFLGTGSKGDEFFLIRFSDQAQLLSPYTQDTHAISRELNGIEAKGWTALNDSIVLAAQHSRKANNQRRVLLILSDGGDNNSRYSSGEMVSMLREADVKVYAVSIFERSPLLERICEETGGRALQVRKLSELPAAMERLSLEMRSEYVLGYNPDTAHNDGKYHRVRITVQPPAGMARVRTSWRHGYFAPGD